MYGSNLRLLRSEFICNVKRNNHPALEIENVS